MRNSAQYLSQWLFAVLMVGAIATPSAQAQSKFLYGAKPSQNTLSTKSEVDEIQNPSWQAVPGTRPASASEEYSEPMYVDVNGLVRNGNTLTFDVVNPDVSYTRLEANCSTNQYRALRFGYFETATRVNYTDRVDPWNEASEPGKRALLQFVCGL